MIILILSLLKFLEIIGECALMEFISLIFIDFYLTKIFKCEYEEFEKKKSKRQGYDEIAGNLLFSSGSTKLELTSDDYKSEESLKIELFTLIVLMR